jgi:hypothetical protein
MSVPTKCFNIVRGRTIRVTSLDECCAVWPDELTAPEAEVAVTDGLISVALTAQIETGEEINDRNWSGALCLTDRSPDEFVRWNLEVTFCNVDPSVISIMSGAPVELDNSTPPNVVGFRTREGAVSSRFALEAWTGVSAAAADCGPGVDPSYGYTLLPCVIAGRMGDLTLENGRADFVITGAFTQSGAGWGAGPYDVVMAGAAPGAAAPLPVPMASGEHHLLRLTTVPPPEPPDPCEAMTLEEAGGTRPVTP